MSQSDVRESLCAIQKYPSALPRDISVCDIVTKKIFSTFAGTTTQSHQMPNLTHSKKTNFSLLCGFYIIQIKLRRFGFRPFSFLFNFLSCFDFGVYFEIQINLP